MSRFTNIEYLAFDAALCGFKVGKCCPKKFNEKAFGKLLQEAKKQSYHLLYLFVSKNDQQSIQTLQKKQLKAIDYKLTYYQQLSSLTESNKPHPNVAICHLQQANETLYQLALLAGQFSRFKMDPQMPIGVFEKMYRAWIDNSLNKTIAQEVLIYQKEQQILGLLTLGLKNKRSDIGLLAVDPRFARQGIGQALLQTALQKSHDWLCQTIQVVTQQANKSACYFYENNGFHIEKTEYVYHLWL